MCQRTMDVRQETIPYQVDVGNIAGKRRSLWDRIGPARKRLLKKDDIWMVGKNIGLKLHLFVKHSDTTNIPGEDVQSRINVEHGA